MKLYDAIQIVLELAGQTTPTDLDEATRQAEAIECLREFGHGYFPGSRDREAKQ